MTAVLRDAKNQGNKEVDRPRATARAVLDGTARALFGLR